MGLQRKAAAVQLGEAAREVGFLYVRGHGSPDALYDGLLAAYIGGSV